MARSAPPRSPRRGRTFPAPLGLCAAVALLGVTSTASTARADGGSSVAQPPPTPTYELHAQYDVPVVAVTGVFAAGWFLHGQLAPAYCAPMCDRHDLNALDRPLAGRYSSGWGSASDASIGAVVVGAAGVLVADEGFGHGLSDGVVVLESLLTADALSVVSTMSTRRPRPLMYGDAAPLSQRMDGNGSLSFFSGHTAGAFAVATSLASTLWRRYRGAPVTWITLGVGLAAASFVGTSRMLAGQHFPTDVIAGAVVGSSVGVLVPALHRAPVQIVPTSTMASGDGGRGGGLALVGAF